MMTIINVYVPNNEADQVSFLEKLHNLMSKKSLSVLDDIVMAGDWNVIRDSNLDKSGGNYNVKRKSVSKIEDIMSQFGLNDVWRIKNPNTRRYTWRQNKPLIQCRLDYILISDALYDKVTRTDIIPAQRTDHSAVMLEIEKLNNYTAGPSLWKFNASLLDDMEYTTLMKTSIESWKREYHNIEDSRVKWELLKYEIRKFTISYSKAKKQQRNNLQRSLEKHLIRLEKGLTDNTIQEYNDVKKQLEDIETSKINGSIIRSKVQWHEDGERSTKYFLSLEKSKALNKHIRKLRLSDGQIVKNPDEIMNAETDYFKKLYTSKLKMNDVSQSDIWQNIVQLDNTDKERIEGLIQKEECDAILKTFQNNKSPGNDGLTPEFYKWFWNEVYEPLISSFNYSYECGELSHSQKQAVITLIHKQDKDRLDLENWRPISLLNTDYKILSKVLTHRLHDVIPKLVLITQSGYVKGRFMSDTVRTLHDIIECSNIHKIDGLLLMVDFTKAFDSIEWPYLFNTLRQKNFGNSFITWIKLLYTNTESCVINNGTTSRYFKLERGVRQGDPLSSYLFILALEVFSSSIMRNNHISGIKINDTEMKLALYADDLTVILKDQMSVNNFLQQMQEFTNISGLQINTSKTTALRLGQLFPFKLPMNIKWITQPTKLLGCYIGSNMLECHRLSIGDKITKIKHTINTWRQRKLSLTGKILVIKSLAISQLTYLANLIPFPDDLIKEIEEIIYTFLYNSKTHKVKKSIIIQDYKHAGQKMIDLKSMIIVQKLKWIRLYLNCHNCLWKPLMESLVSVKNLTMFLLSNYDMKDLWTRSAFYNDVIRCLSNVNKNNNICIENNILKQNICYNKLLKFDGKYMYCDDMIQAGIWKVCDLYDSNGTPIQFDELLKRGVDRQSYLYWRNILLKVKKYNRNFDWSCNTISSNLIVELNDGDNFDIQTSKSKIIYDKIVSLQREIPKSFAKYSKLFPNFDESTHKYACLIPRICTKNNKLKDIQYQIIHRFLPTNHLLFKMSKVESARCNLCQLQSETILHLFYECTHVKELWHFIQSVLNNIHSSTIMFSCQDIVLGYKYDTVSTINQHINAVILYVKSYIWHSRKRVECTSVDNLKLWLSKKKLYDDDLTCFCDHM